MKHFLYLSLKSRQYFAGSAIVLWILTALLLAGCRQGPRTQAGSMTSNGRVVVNFWNGFTGPDGKTMEQIVAQFRRDNPDIEVKMQIIPWGTYYDKLTLSLAYSGAPEVFVMHASRLPEYAAYDTIQPLTELYATAQPPVTEEEFAPVPWRATFYKGKQMAFPLDIHPMGMYYNTELFKKAGIVDAEGQAKPPTNLEEFIEAGKKLTKDTDGDGRIDQWGFVFTFQRTNWQTIADQFGVSILSEDEKRCTLDVPGNMQALSLMHDFIYKYKIAPKPEGVDAWLSFRQGKVGMAFEGIYMLSSLEEQKGLAFAGAPVPQFGPKRAVWGGSHLLCQPAGISPRHSRAAWRLMRYLSDRSLQWAKGGQVPVRLDILHSPEFKALPVQAQFARQVDVVQYDSWSPHTNALFPFIDPAVEAVLLDLQTPQEAMSDAARRINQILERY